MVMTALVLMLMLLDLMDEMVLVLLFDRSRMDGLN